MKKNKRIDGKTDLYWKYYEEREKLEEMARKAWAEDACLSGDELVQQNRLVDELYIKNIRHMEKKK